MKSVFFVLSIILLTVPAFFRMLRPGIHTTQDPVHYFRLVEYDKCVRNFLIPCRWAPDAGLGYGEPVFNFYGQASYALGEMFHLLGAQFIDSLKLLFIISLVGSGLSMFFLARHLWGNNFSAIISGVVYVYAPYRAVNVWVRGALPEAMSFAIIPLVILSIEKKSLRGFGILLALLILNHNLSAFMFFPVILAWVFYRKFWKAVYAVFLSLLISSFYLLPLVFESKYINLYATTQGYFDFRGHFASLYELFISRYWGYGASLFQEAQMSRSIGLIQWMLPLTIILVLFLRKETKKYKKFLIWLVLGVGALFLTHSHSTFLWLAIDSMRFLQFPWRFLGVSIFCLSLATGAFPLTFRKYKALVSLLIVTITILLNFSYFREDIWMSVSDAEMTSGVLWDTQIRSSIGDFWPNFGHIIPSEPATGEYINYFPGWSKEPDKNGLIKAEGAVFNDTPVRTVGNVISLVTLCVTLLSFLV